MSASQREPGGVPSQVDQLAWLQALRPQTRHIEFVFNNADDAEHPLTQRLAHLASTRWVGAPAGNGYARPRPAAIVRRYAYDRDIVRALEGLGGFFRADGAQVTWSELGDVDVVFLGGDGEAVGATVTHEGILLGGETR